MTLKIQDMGQAYYVDNSSDLEVILSKREGSGVNEFWLSHDNEKNPALSIVVNGDLASLTYFPEAHHPGFTSIGPLENLQSGELSIFYINTPTEKHLILNDSIVPFSTAVDVAKEFFIKKNLPSSIEWLEL